MKTMKDFLRSYNNCDVIPSCTEEKFSLFKEEDKELFYLLKRNSVGGPSIIFHRHHESWYY
jgi:hypothetical protein